MMFHLSPLLNILYKTIRYSGKNILRDFTEIENLQSSVKDTKEYINKSLKRLNENISVNLIKIKKNVSIVDIKQNPLTTCWIVSSVDSTISYSRGIPEFLIVVSYRENVVAGQDPHQNGVCIIEYNSGGIMVSNIDADGGTLVRVSTCYGETTRLYDEWIVY